MNLEINFRVSICDAAAVQKGLVTGFFTPAEVVKALETTNPWMIPSFQAEFLRIFERSVDVEVFEGSGLLASVFEIFEWRSSYPTYGATSFIEDFFKKVAQKQIQLKDDVYHQIVEHYQRTAGDFISQNFNAAFLEYLLGNTQGISTDEITMIKMRFGIGRPKLPLRDIAPLVSLSASRITQRVDKAIRKLRQFTASLCSAYSVSGGLQIQTKPNLLAVSVSSLCLSVRACRFLSDFNIMTLQDFIDLPAGFFPKNSGRKVFMELADALISVGIDWDANKESFFVLNS